jgi:hypothetical protein
MTELAYLKPRNTEWLLVQVMEALAGNETFISLEGFQIPQEVCSLPEAHFKETDILRRNTTSPILQFVVVPLNQNNLTILKAAIGQAPVLEAEGGLIHTQIAKDGQLVFGAYDNVHEECTVLYSPYIEPIANNLVKTGAIFSFEVKRRDT